MNVCIFRHGLTQANQERRYLGSTDVSLSEEGRALLLQKEPLPGVKKVYVSPMKRCVESAGILFPNAEIERIDGLREMNFGIFEMKTADEMESDPDFRRWVDGMCEGNCPEGEDMHTFRTRTEQAFVRILEKSHQEDIYIMAHAGTAMAIMSRFAIPKKSYWDWHIPSGGCITAEVRKCEGEWVLEARTPNA